MLLPIQNNVKETKKNPRTARRLLVVFPKTTDIAHLSIFVLFFRSVIATATAATVAACRCIGSFLRRKPLNVLCVERRTLVHVRAR